MSGFEVLVASDIRRDDIFVEISYDGEVLAELSGSEPGDSIKIALYARPGGKDWAFDICELQATLERAKQRMLVLQQPLEAEATADD